MECMETVREILYNDSDQRKHIPGGGVLTIVSHTGRLRPKGVSSLSSQYIKGWGKLPFWYTKGSQNQLRSGGNGG